MNDIEIKTIETKKKYNNSYYLKHKISILEHANKEKHCNICNKITSVSNWSKHIKSDKHRLNVKINELQNKIT